MSGKQMEGDNQRRRTLARRARARGARPSEAGVTLGAGKQLEHQDHIRRAGPPPAGGRKAGPGRAEPPATAQPQPHWPPPQAPTATPGTGAAVVGYRELVGEISRQAGIGFDEARAAAGATVAALARALAETDRERLLEAVPSQLRDQRMLATVNRRLDLAGFLDEITRLTGHAPEQARYQAQATLTALAGRDHGLVASLDLPRGLADLLGPPPAAGGGLVDVAGHPGPLSQEELRNALADLPYWSVERGALTRAIALPRANLDRVLGLLSRLRPQTGRGPRIGRESADLAVITVRTGRRNEVSGLDVELAHRIDAAIEEAGAGVA